MSGDHQPAQAPEREVPAIAWAVGLLSALVIVFWLGNRHFISLYNLNTIASYAAILLVVGLGQMCTILIGGIDLSVGGLMSLTAVVFVLSLRVIGYWAYPLCLAMGLAVGYLNGTILTRVRIPSFLATLGTGGIMSSLALLVSPLPVDVPASHYHLLSVVNGSVLHLKNLLLLALGSYALFHVVLRFTVVGNNILYVGSNITMSWMSGIDIVRTRNLAYVLSGLAASVASILISCGQFGGDPTLGSVYVLSSIAAVVVGGTAMTGGAGGPVNTLIGAAILSVMENGMNVVGVNAFFQQSILGAVIIVSVYLTFDRSKVPVVK
ncbi:MAG TPA: ABC transporter permease [Anaeromyxobacter sp.]|nr:ABC transporter permease [Anaeromyxobacter sp.]